MTADRESRIRKKKKKKKKEQQRRLRDKEKPKMPKRMSVKEREKRILIFEQRNHSSLKRYDVKLHENWSVIINESGASSQIKTRPSSPAPDYIRWYTLCT